MHQTYLGPHCSLQLGSLNNGFKRILFRFLNVVVNMFQRNIILVQNALNLLGFYVPILVIAYLLQVINRFIKHIRNEVVNLSH